MNTNKTNVQKLLDEAEDMVFPSKYLKMTSSEILESLGFSFNYGSYRKNYLGMDVFAYFDGRSGIFRVSESVLPFSKKVNMLVILHVIKKLIRSKSTSELNKLEIVLYTNLTQNDYDNHF